MCTYLKTIQWSRALGLAEVLGGDEMFALLDWQGSLKGNYEFQPKKPWQWRVGGVALGAGLLDDDLAVLCERHGHSKPSSEAAVQPRKG